MHTITILKLQNDGLQKPIAVCRLQTDGTVVCEGDAEVVKNFTENGITDYETKKKLFPKDGVLFLAQLKHNFKSGYFSVVEEA